MGQPAEKMDDTPHIPNDFDLTEAEKRALLVNSLVEIERLTDDKNKVVADIRNKRKKLIANGFTGKVIDFALRLRKQKDEDTIEQRKAEIEVARLLNHPIGTQFDMFYDTPDRTPEVERAAALGFTAGAAGQTCQSPYGAGSEFDQVWIENWHKGQATITSAFRKLEAKEAAEAEDDAEGDED
ncbi:GapR family DNA-binding domain-containing protein [Rhodopseudomonas sp. B29]|uniref:GapR family DNA-binding domain-containing protein n=1 Tax=Rhodopseudomonas sp. B29 TaxID=95607 RepID=UPI0003489B70|nr:GapR family DNA-binding domain-containing protein [Rhodopseudomonas sp. B29]